MTRYSHSRIKTFENCPYQYKLQYIDRIMPDIPSSIEAFMGCLVHAAMEKLYKDLSYQKMNTKEELLAYYNEKWEREWTDDILIVKQEYGPDNYRKMGERFISDYYDHYHPFDQMRILGIETKDFMTLSDGNQWHVRIDILGEKDGVYYVCDFKTNSRMKDQEEADEDKQLAMYSIWVKNRFPDAKRLS
jgi:RecB family exonuclease